jgi:FkbM family methyltransferase
MTSREPLAAAQSSHYRERPCVEIVGERFRGLRLPPPLRAWLKRAYYAALMARTGGRGIACRLPEGEVVRVHPEQRYISWNPVEYQAFRRAVPRGGVALDVGANVGAYAIALGQWVGPSGRVFAFEPAPDPFAGLVRHLRLNRLQHIVRPVQRAIADDIGPSRLLVSATAGESRLVVPGDRDETVQSVDAITIDAFCAEHRLAPDFIKIDIEGWELAALRGARETIRAGRGRLALFIEMHPSIWPIVGVTRTDLLNELDRQGLEVRPLTREAAPWQMEGVCVRLAYR